MSIQGTFTDYELSEVLLSLSFNRQTGTLVINFPNGNSRNIYFQDGGIFVIYSNSQSIDELEKILVNAKRATKKQMKSAMAEQEKSSRFIGEVIRDMELLNEEELVSILNSYIEDSLFSILVDEDSTFDFQPGIAPEDLSPQFSPLVIEANLHTIECFNYLEDWKQIRGYFPTLKEIFTLAQPLESIEIENVADVEKNELHLLDGTRNVAEVFCDSIISNIRMGEMIANLVYSNQIAALTMEDAKQRGNGHKNKSEFEEALKFYTYCETLDQPDGEVSYKMAEAFEHLGQIPEATQYYRQAADIFFDEEKFDDVIKAYMKILSFDSADDSALAKLLDSFFRSGKKEETQKVGVQLGEILMKTQQFDNAIQVYSHLVKLFPRETPYRKQLALCYSETGQPDLATKQHNIINRIEVELQKRAKEKTAQRMRKMVSMALLVVILGAVYFFGTQLYDRIQGEKCFEKAQQVEAQLHPQIQLIQNFDTKRERMLDIVKAYEKCKGYSRTKNRVDEKIAEWQKKLNDLEGLETQVKQMRIRLKKLNKEAQEALKKGDYKTLFNKHSSILKNISLPEVDNVRLPLVLNLSPLDAKVVINNEERASEPGHPKLFMYKLDTTDPTLKIQIEKKGYEPQTFFIRNADKFQTRDLFLDKQYNWKVRVGSQISKNFDDAAFDTSPIILKHGGKEKVYAVARNGYVYCYPLEGSKRQTNSREWRSKVGGSGEYFSPLLDMGKDSFVLATGSGRVYTVGKRRGRIQYEQVSNKPLRAKPLKTPIEGISIVSGNDGMIHNIYVDGERVNRFNSIEVSQGKILSTPYLKAGKGGTHSLIITSTDGTIHRFNWKGASKDGRPYFESERKWVMATESDIVASPIVHKGVVYFGNYAGWFYAVDFKSGRMLWKRKTSSPIVGSAMIISKDQIEDLETDVVVFGNLTGELFLLSLKESRGKVGGSYEVLATKQLEPIYSAPVFRDGHLYLGTREKYREHVLRLSKPLDNRQIYKGRILAINSESVILEDEKNYKKEIPQTDIIRILRGQYKEKGILYSLQISPKSKDKILVMWKFPVVGGINSSPAIHSENIVVSTTHGYLYSVSK